MLELSGHYVPSVANALLDAVDSGVRMARPQGLAMGNAWVSPQARLGDQTVSPRKVIHEYVNVLEHKIVETRHLVHLKHFHTLPMIHSDESQSLAFPQRQYASKPLMAFTGGFEEGECSSLSG